MKTPTVPVADKTFLTIPEAAALLSVGSRDKVYRLIKQGLPAVRLGGVLRVHGPGLREWAAQLTAEQLAEREETMNTLLVFNERKR